jgi:hypothetical protein
MQAPFETEFLIRRIGQLWTEAAALPEKSPAQAHIEELACRFPTTFRLSTKQWLICRRSLCPDPISAVGFQRSSEAETRSVKDRRQFMLRRITSRKIIQRSSRVGAPDVASWALVG